MNKKEELLKDHLNELEQISKSSLNENQKELIKLNLEILKNNDKISIDDFEQIWRFLKQRVATGFVFDEAPEINNQSIAILEKDEKLSFSSSKMKDNLQNCLIIGENYDVLKNLIGVERERMLTSI